MCVWSKWDIALNEYLQNLILPLQAVGKPFMKLEQSGNCGVLAGGDFLPNTFLNKCLVLIPNVLSWRGTRSVRMLVS